MQLSWSQAAVLGAGVGALALPAARWRRSRPLAPFLGEAALLAFLYSAWQLLLDGLVTGTGGAVGHGRWVWRTERDIGLPSEAAFQAPFLGHPWWVRTADAYYAAAHFTVMGLFLAWMFARHRPGYPRVRLALLLATLAAALIQAVPVAPPRLVPGLGVVDAARRLGQSVYSANGLTDPGQLIAMPSVHVGWAALVAVGTWWATSSRWRWLGAAHLVVTLAVVVATGNHYWLDAAVGMTLTGGAWGLAVVWTRRAALQAAGVRRRRWSGPWRVASRR